MCSCCYCTWSTSCCLQRYPSSFPLCDLQNQIFWSTVMQSHDIIISPQRRVAVGPAGRTSAAAQSRLVLYWLFPVVCQQVCILWLLASCFPAYLVLLLLYFSSAPILINFSTPSSSPNLTWPYGLNGIWTSRDFSWHARCRNLWVLLEMALLLHLPLCLFYIFLCRESESCRSTTVQQGNNFPGHP